MTAVKLLAIDASTAVCSAALLAYGQLTERSLVAPQQHTALLLPMVESLLEEAGITIQQLDALAFGCGPGSFTGLRIAAGIIQGIALATNLPVVLISTLHAMAHAACHQLKLSHVAVALDARMGDVYWGCYALQDYGGCFNIVPDGLTKPSVIQLLDHYPWVGIGNGWQLARMPKIAASYPDYYPQASAIAKLASKKYLAGKVVTAIQAQPIYLRDSVV